MVFTRPSRRKGSSKLKSSSIAQSSTSSTKKTPLPKSSSRTEIPPPIEPEPTDPPQAYTVDPSSPPRRYLECFLLNYLSRPSLLQTTPVTSFFLTYPSKTIHFTERLIISNPLHECLFRDTGLDSPFKLYHIDIRINTAIRYSLPSLSLFLDLVNEEEEWINRESEREEKRGE